MKNKHFCKKIEFGKKGRTFSHLPNSFATRVHFQELYQFIFPINIFIKIGYNIHFKKLRPSFSAASA
jgi:hypothetical protein